VLVATTLLAAQSQTQAQAQDQAQAAGEELHWLVERGEAARVRALLEQGADPRLANRLGVTPLYLAAANGDAEIIELLLAAGADPNARDTVGETMLMAAVGSGELEAVATLLAHGGEVNALDTAYDQTALMFAARAGYEPIVDALLAAGATVDARTRVDDEPRWILPNSRAGFGFGKGIIRGGLPEDRGMRPFRGGGLTPLLYAAREGHTATVARLLDAGAAIDGVEANDISPLLMAIANDRMATATLLVERGAAIDRQDWYGRSPLWEAVNVRNLYVHNQTFEHNVDREGALGVVRLLLQRGADPNPRTKESPPVRNHLLATTGTLEWVDFTGQTPFLAAALAGDVTVMRLLLEHGADPDIATVHGTTPLMAAAGVNWVVSQTYTEGPEQLLAAVELCHGLGMDVNAVNSMGITAVMGAANRGSDAIIEYLVANGARLDVVDDEGRSPLDWAKGVFLATHPAEPKPSSIALIERLMAD
jgi:ankyrin repeat protein